MAWLQSARESKSWNIADNAPVSQYDSRAIRSPYRQLIDSVKLMVYTGLYRGVRIIKVKVCDRILNVINVKAGKPRYYLDLNKMEFFKIDVEGFFEIDIERNS